MDAALVIGAVLVPGNSAPKIIKRTHLRTMPKGAVFVDVAIDQGGCSETSRPTTHSDPVYTEEGVIHYCVTNMPSVVPRTSNFALNHVTKPYILALADKGTQKACLEDKYLAAGLNVYQGHITHPAVAHALGKPYKEGIK